jgi:hypothetical protein
VRIATVVEGHGEVAALPILLRRIAAAITPDIWLDLPRAHRVGRGSMLRRGGIEAVLAVVAERVGPNDGIAVVLDADDDCPAAVAPTLLARCRASRADRRIYVLANREFEAWFLAAATSLAGQRGLRSDLTAPPDPERPRDCKGWLSAHRGWAYV